MTSPHINQLRDHLMETLAALRDRDNPMEPDRDRAVAQVASVLVDTAKVEVDYLKATGQDRSSFLEEPVTATIAIGNSSPFPPGITGVTQHRLQG